MLNRKASTLAGMVVLSLTLAARDASACYDWCWRICSAPTNEPCNRGPGCSVTTCAVYGLSYTQNPLAEAPVQPNMSPAWKSAFLKASAPTVSSGSLLQFLARQSSTSAPSWDVCAPRG
jgi:hypothetical protein